MAFAMLIAVSAKKDGFPLVFIPHILGNMDSWDPSVTDGFAADREVILFNNAGIASSGGEVPVTFAEMAKGAGMFIDALGLTKVDVLGFSIGSMIAQNVAMERPDLVHKLVIVGSGPRNGDGIPLNPESQAIFSNKYGNLDDFWIEGFFTASQCMIVPCAMWATLPSTSTPLRRLRATAEWLIQSHIDAPDWDLSTITHRRAWQTCSLHPFRLPVALIHLRRAIKAFCSGARCGWPG